MVIRRAYKRDKVNSVDVNAVYARGEQVKSAVIGLDIAKEEIVACLRWGMDSYERPWSVSNPSEINVLTEILISLRSKGIELKVAMESTGTYGDAVRLVSTKNQFQVYRVSGMHVKNLRRLSAKVSKYQRSYGAGVTEPSLRRKQRTFFEAQKQRWVFP